MTWRAVRGLASPGDAISIAALHGDQLVHTADQDEPKLSLHETGELASVEVIWDP
jgi:hypothetical protein